MPLLFPSLKTLFPTSSECVPSYLGTRPLERVFAQSQGGASFLSKSIGFISSAGGIAFFQYSGCQNFLTAPLASISVHSPFLSSIFFRSGLRCAGRNAQGGRAPHDFSLNPLCTKTIKPSQARTPHGRNPRMDNKMK